MASRLQPKDFILMEVMASIALVAIVLVLALTLIRRTGENVQAVSAREQAQAQARLVTDHLVNQIRGAIRWPPESPSSHDLVLRSSTDPSHYVRYRFDPETGQLWIETVKPDEHVHHVLNVSDRLLDAAFNVNPTEYSLSLQLLFHIPGDEPYRVETAVFVPKWNRHEQR